MLQKQSLAQSCQQLLEHYQGSTPAGQAEKLHFANIGDSDVYNISSPFLDQGQHVIAGRMEQRSSERSTTMFFVEDHDGWHPRENTPAFALQDPFFTFVAGELVLGGVEVVFDPSGEQVVTWRTQLYRGACINALQHFCTGPEHMKDIRLCELLGGKILVLTRPLGLADARAAIGYCVIDRLDDLNATVIDAASLFRDQFLPDEWGGANQAHVLKNGLVAVLGHIACMEAGDIRHYYAMTFAMKPETGEKTLLKIIATRKDFPPGPAKRPDLVDVIFSGGLVRQPDGTAWLYAGVSDAEAHRLCIVDPFVEYEQL